MARGGSDLLPTSIHRKLAELAEQEGISINQLINSAVAEKMAALLTEDYLQQRARRGTRQKFNAVLAKVRDAEPSEEDRLPRRKTTPKRRSSTR